MAEVTISLEDYKSFIEKPTKHEMMVNAIFDVARLHYSGNKLSFYDDTLDNVLMVLEHDTYTARLHELQAKEEEE